MNRLAIILAIVLASSGAFAAPKKAKAQTPLPPATAVTGDASAPVNQPVVVNPGPYYFELEKPDLDLLSAAINELPKKLADPLLTKMNGQLQAQSKIIMDRNAAMKK